LGLETPRQLLLHEVGLEAMLTKMEGVFENRPSHFHGKTIGTPMSTPDKNTPIG